MTKKFILWDDSNDPVDISCDLYTWTGYSENENIKSLLKYVDSNGAHFRKVYVRWSYDPVSYTHLTLPTIYSV